MAGSIISPGRGSKCWEEDVVDVADHGAAGSDCADSVVDD